MLGFGALASLQGWVAMPGDASRALWCQAGADGHLMWRQQGGERGQSARPPLAPPASSAVGGRGG